jgi:hypothetical protein
VYNSFRKKLAFTFEVEVLGGPYELGEDVQDGQEKILYWSSYWLFVELWPLLFVGAR